MNNLQRIQAYHAAIWDDKNGEAVSEYFHEDVAVHSPIGVTHGSQQLKNIITAWHVAFPNLKVHWDSFICEDDKVVCQWHAEGKQEGEFQGVKASGKTVHYPGITVYQLEDGKVRQYWAYVDMENVKRQLTA